jgi:hypothetical protein
LVARSHTRIAYFPLHISILYSTFSIKFKSCVQENHNQPRVDCSVRIKLYTTINFESLWVKLNSELYPWAPVESTITGQAFPQFAGFSLKKLSMWKFKNGMILNPKNRMLESNEYLITTDLSLLYGWMFFNKFSNAFHCSPTQRKSHIKGDDDEPKWHPNRISL